MDGFKTTFRPLPVRIAVGLIYFHWNLISRCFAYTHHMMPNDPLVILHVALIDDISDSIQTSLLIEFFSLYKDFE
jgi:hypothetical protein